MMVFKNIFDSTVIWVCVTNNKVSGRVPEFKTVIKLIEVIYPHKDTYLCMCKCYVTYLPINVQPTKINPYQQY